MSQSQQAYTDRSAPFWDFIASLEEQASQHPFFAGNTPQENARPNPWSEGWAGMPWGPMPHRGRHEAPPPQHEGSSGPPNADEAGPSESRGPPPPEDQEGHESGGPRHGPGRQGRHGRHGHGPHHGPGSRGGPCGRGRGGAWGRRRGPFNPNAMGPFGPLAEIFQSQLFGQDGANDKETDKEAEEDFKPEADVFDTTESFVVHVSLAGAKRGDLGVNYDAEKSEIIIAGVIYRPGDEDFLKTLSLGERKVGAFERKVRLGSRANPAHVDADGITAKLEDGILRVNVPKLDAGYVEIKRVDIE